MKVLKKQGVAVMVMLVAIAAAIAIGWWRMPQASAKGQSGELDTSLDTSTYANLVWDQADILSASTEKSIGIYNANWDYRYVSVVSVVTVNGLDGQDITDISYNQAYDLGLGEGDAVLQGMAEQGLRLYFLSSPFAAYNLLLATLFPSVERALPAHALSLLRGLVLLVPAAFAFAALWGLVGVWLAVPVTEAVTAAAGYLVLRRERARGFGGELQS